MCVCGANLESFAPKHCFRNRECTQSTPANATVSILTETFFALTQERGQTERTQIAVILSRREENIGVPSAPIHQEKEATGKMHTKNSLEETTVPYASRALSVTVEQMTAPSNSVVRQNPAPHPHWHDTERCILTIGGRNNSDSAEVFLYHSHATGKERGWQKQPPLKQARNGLAAACAGGKIFAIGGAGRAMDKQMEWRDLKGDETWQVGPTMAAAHRWCAAASLGDRVIVLAGSNCKDVECFDINTERWIDLPPLQNKRSHLAATTLDNVVYAVGGWQNSDGIYQVAQPVDVVERFDLRTNKWDFVTALPSPRHSLAAVAYNGFLYTFGGATSRGFCGSVESFDPRNGRWTAVQKMSMNRKELAAAVCGESTIMVMGGYMTDSVESFNVDSLTWSAAECLPSPCAGLAAVSFCC